MNLTKIQKNKKILAVGAVFVVLLLPLISFAAATNFKALVTSVVGIMNIVQNFLVALSVFIIIWGTFRYLIASGDKERLTKAKDVIVYGLLGIVIIYSIMGIIQILLGTFQFTGGKPLIPQL